MRDGLFIAEVGVFGWSGGERRRRWSGMAASEPAATAPVAF